jgi:hypothetical protein
MAVALVSASPVSAKAPKSEISEPVIFERPLVRPKKELLTPVVIE